LLALLLSQVIGDRLNEKSDILIILVHLLCTFRVCSCLSHGSFKVGFIKLNEFCCQLCRLEIGRLEHFGGGHNDLAILLHLLLLEEFDALQHKLFLLLFERHVCVLANEFLECDHVLWLEGALQGLDKGTSLV